MNARHRAAGGDEPELEPGAPPADRVAVREHPFVAAGVVGHLLHLRLLLTVINAVAGVAFAANRPGVSTSFDLFRVFAPLPVWAGGFLLASALLAASRWGESLAVAGHTLATFLWLVYAAGAVNSLVASSSPSPTGTITVAGLVSGTAGYHAAALWFRRKLARQEAAPPH